MAVRVKICGLTRPEDARAAVEAGADAVGVNLWKGSARHVTVEEARTILAEVPAGVLRVGVFVNAPREEILDAVSRAGLDVVQLHGDETPAECEDFPVPVIKAIRAADEPDLAKAAAAYETVEWILLDSGGGGRYGGSGETFPWDRAAGVAPGRLFLAGGLTPENVADAVRRVRPWAVDVAGGVETAPGVKDRRKIRELIAHARNA